MKIPTSALRWSLSQVQEGFHIHSAMLYMFTWPNFVHRKSNPTKFCNNLTACWYSWSERSTSTTNNWIFVRLFRRMKTLRALALLVRFVLVFPITGLWLFLNRNAMGGAASVPIISCRDRGRIPSSVSNSSVPCHNALWSIIPSFDRWVAVASSCRGWFGVAKLRFTAIGGAPKVPPDGNKEQKNHPSFKASGFLFPPGGFTSFRP